MLKTLGADSSRLLGGERPDHDDYTVFRKTSSLLGTLTGGRHSRLDLPPHESQKEVHPEDGRPQEGQSFLRAGPPLHELYP